MSQRNIDDDEELDRLHAIIDQWAPVIEAAKAWRERMLKYAVCEQEYTLMAAVEELLAAEGEE